jgi:4-diphosphocytidyl-2-C-methyl-D-erythritol kinase
MVLKEKAYAKVNLILDVLEKRPDSYHNIGSVFHSISLCDYLEGRRLWSSAIVIEEEGLQVGIPVEENLVYRAAKAMQVFAPECGIKIVIQKFLPMGAGMGGGSADAAAVLRLCNRLWGLHFSNARLAEIGARLGADVPFMVSGKCAQAEGIGDILTPLDSSLSLPLIVITPNAFVSTAKAYAGLKPQGLLVWEKAQANIAKIGVSKAMEMYNHFESTVLKEYPEIAKIYHKLEETKPVKTLLSGSGASVFAVYESTEQQQLALSNLRFEKRFFSGLGFLKNN